MAGNYTASFLTARSTLRSTVQLCRKEIASYKIAEELCGNSFSIAILWQLRHMAQIRPANRKKVESGSFWDWKTTLFSNTSSTELGRLIQLKSIFRLPQTHLDNMQWKNTWSGSWFRHREHKLLPFQPFFFSTIVAWTFLLKSCHRNFLIFNGTPCISRCFSQGFSVQKSVIHIVCISIMTVCYDGMQIIR